MKECDDSRPMAHCLNNWMTPREAINVMAEEGAGLQVNFPLLQQKVLKLLISIGVTRLLVM